MNDTIDRFVHEHRYLSNFYPSTMWWNGWRYRTAEHAFQEAKTLSADWQARIRDTVSPGQAKRLGRQAPLRPDWDQVKLAVMHNIVTAKFASNMDLTQRLLGTGDRPLIEGNNWGDTYWGVCDGVGLNHLGSILMRVRTEAAVTFYEDTGIPRR